MLKHLDRKWLRIGIYYAIAMGVSFLARFYWHSGDRADPSNGALSLWWHLVSALGPFAGALLIWTLYRPAPRISFGGTWPAMGAAMLAVPMIVMAVLGVDNGFAMEPHLFGAYLGIWIATYALLEETGWRGYLQQEFRDRHALLRYSIVGLFWYAWHFSFLGGGALASEAANLLFIVLASIGIGFVADRTGSILAAASFHVIGNVLITTSEFKTIIPSSQDRLLIVLTCVVIWLLMLRLWRMRDLRHPSRRSPSTDSGR
jgi:membrane protease YdiL (CAAX protease family)